MKNGNLYLKTMNCPVCNHIFKATKVKSRAIRISGTDSDFCAYFQGENPYFYEVVICSECGYAATDNEYEKINNSQKEVILKEISPRWIKRDVNGERTINDAINAYKLALHESILMKKEYKYSGLLALKLAWFYRYKKDSESEKRFLDIALQGFKNAYKKESFDSSFSLGKCCYIIAEIYIRLGDDTKAVRWYDIALRYCKFDGVQLQRQIRERWQEICERKRMIKDGVS